MKWVRLTPGVLYTSVTFFLLAMSIVIGASVASVVQPSGSRSSSHALASAKQLPAPLVPQRRVGTMSRPHVLGAQTAEPLNCRQTSCLALTFDDGPNPITTPQILSTLEKYHVTASFFVVGKRITGNQSLIARMHQDGFEVESHSWSHPDLTKLPPDQIKEQFAFSALAIEASGGSRPTLMRPPYGAVNQAVIDASPVPLAMWNEDPKDWHPGITAAQVVANVEGGAKPGGVVDLHDIYQTTADALPQVITDLSARGFHFVTFSQLNQPVVQAHTEYFGLKP